jgi:hypothetical protein
MEPSHHLPTLAIPSIILSFLYLYHPWDHLIIHLPYHPRDHLIIYKVHHFISYLPLPSLGPSHHSSMYPYHLWDHLIIHLCTLTIPGTISSFIYVPLSSLGPSHHPSMYPYHPWDHLIIYIMYHFISYIPLPSLRPSYHSSILTILGTLSPSIYPNPLGYYLTLHIPKSSQLPYLYPFILNSCYHLTIRIPELSLVPILHLSILSLLSPWYYLIILLGTISQPRYRNYLSYSLIIQLYLRYWVPCHNP